jgi:uncharacterized RDD family membrane protein YckC
MNTIWIPFLSKPKKPDGGPRFGDVYERTLAAGMDMWIAFTLLDIPFRSLTNFLYADIDRAALVTSTQADSSAEMIAQMWDAGIAQVWLMNSSLQILIIGALVVACQCAYGTTPGKWIMGLRVVDAKTLQPLSWWRYVVRFFAYLPACAPLMIGVIWMTFNKRRRGWHDCLAGTVVLNLRPEGWYWNHFKRGIRRLMGRPQPKVESAVEEPMGEPAAEKRHQDGERPIE